MSKRIISILIISLTTGVLSGCLSSLFLKSLENVTLIRDLHPHLIWGLPVFGFLFGFLLKKIPTHLNQGIPYILREIENPTAKVSVWMTPFIFLSSLATHLFGGSAGREGVGVIMGASISHILPKFHNSFKSMRVYLIYAGISAGFSSIFGTPLTAIIFSFELHRFKDRKKIELMICSFVASFVAYLMTVSLGVTHQHISVSLNGEAYVVYMILTGLVSGMAGNIFYWSMKGYTYLLNLIFRRIEIRFMIGGLLVTAIVWLTHAYDYIGIGTHMISKSFMAPMSFYDFSMKMILTVMTLSVGFKGGEVTPLFFIGATLGNATLSSFNYSHYALSSSLGMVSLFGAVTNTPLASSLMAYELFGPEVGLLSLGSCYIAKLMMMKKSIYKHI